MPPDLVVLGNLLLDDVVHEDGTTRMAQPGGATLFVALGASLWKTRVGIVSRLGDDYPTAVLDALTERGVELAGVHRLGRPGLRTWLLYEGRRRRVVHRLDGPTHAEVSPTPGEIPESWLGSRAFHLAPMPPAVQHALVDALETRRDALLSLDPYEILDAANAGEWTALARRVDVLFLSEDEVTLPGVDDDPRPVLRRIGGGRLGLVVFKRGARGGLVYDVRRDAFSVWTARPTEVVDATGAGDAFAGGFLAGRLRGETDAEAVERALTSASFALAGVGADGLFAAERP